MKILDLFCGAGGAAMGLHHYFPEAEITGVDLKPQPHYPFVFVQADAMEYPLAGYDFIWSSPPCQHYMKSGMVNHIAHPDLVPGVRLRLGKSDAPWIIENVPGAPLRASMLLCGTMFGLGVRRHRLFETSFAVGPLGPAWCDHSRRITGVYGHPHGRGGAWSNSKRPHLPSDLPTWSREMGIDWMTASELSQAIPPCYSEYLAQFIPGPDTKTAQQ